MKYQNAADLLRDRILSEEFSVGDKLPGLYRLARQYSVSLETMRHSVRILQNEGLLITKQGAGTFVVSKLLGRSKQSYLQQLSEVRKQLELAHHWLNEAERTLLQLEETEELR